MARQDESSTFPRKYLSDKKIPWQRSRRLGMVVAENMPTASFLTKIGKMQSAVCRLCRIAREARGESTDSLAAETHGHINSAGCEGMATIITEPMMMIAFITFNSSSVFLIQGLCSLNPWEFEFSGFRRNRTDDLGIDSPSL